jgi:hypothetical protein
MNETIHVDPFEAKFEDVGMHFYKFSLTFLNEVAPQTTPKNTAYASVFESVVIHHYAPTGRDCVGTILIIFRNQGKDFNSCLQLNCSILASSYSETSGRSLFCKIIQYLFEWTEKYVDEKKHQRQIWRPFYYAQISLRERSVYHDRRLITFFL